MLCCFASSLTNAQYMWGPNESQRLEMEKKLDLPSAHFFCLPPPSPRPPAPSPPGWWPAWCPPSRGCRWGTVDGALLVRLRRQVLPHNRHTHPPCLSPAVSGQAGLHFSTQFVFLYFSTVFLSYHTQRQRHTDIIASCLRAGRPGFFTLAQLSQVGSNLLWREKTRLFTPDMSFLLCSLLLRAKKGEIFGAISSTNINC